MISNASKTMQYLQSFAEQLSRPLSALESEKVETAIEIYLSSVSPEASLANWANILRVFLRTYLYSTAYQSFSKVLPLILNEYPPLTKLESLVAITLQVCQKYYPADPIDPNSSAAKGCPSLKSVLQLLRKAVDKAECVQMLMDAHVQHLMETQSTPIKWWILEQLQSSFLLKFKSQLATALSAMLDSLLNRKASQARRLAIYTYFAIHIPKHPNFYWALLGKKSTFQQLSLELHRRTDRIYALLLLNLFTNQHSETLQRSIFKMCPFSMPEDSVTLLRNTLIQIAPSDTPTVHQEKLISIEGIQPHLPEDTLFLLHLLTWKMSSDTTDSHAKLLDQLAKLTQIPLESMTDWYFALNIASPLSHFISRVKGSRVSPPSPLQSVQRHMQDLDHFKLKSTLHHAIQQGITANQLLQFLSDTLFLPEPTQKSLPAQENSCSLALYSLLNITPRHHQSTAPIITLLSTSHTPFNSSLRLVLSMLYKARCSDQEYINDNWVSVGLKRMFTIRFGRVNQMTIRRWVQQANWRMLYCLLLSGYKVKTACEQLLRSSWSADELGSLINVDGRVIGAYLAYQSDKNKYLFRHALASNDYYEGEWLMDAELPHLMLRSD